jgi:ADP-ribosyl-[dinitrogen reductase] hydrolase
MSERYRFRGCLLGLAVGDAVGTAVEFSPRGTFEPISDMVGGGPFNLRPGEWTDDTSMALCLAASLTELGRFDPCDQMQRYLRWMEHGYMGSNGTCVDIGITTSDALRAFKSTGEPFSGPTSPRTAGNGCIMRLAPVPMFCYPNRARVAELSVASSRTTHGAQECLEASSLLGDVVFRALSGLSKEDVLFADLPFNLDSPSVRRIAEGDYVNKSPDGIRGTGYVIDCLEAALWCFHGTDNYREAVLLATNLGDDADTTAAVCGQVAGAFYGEQGIPAEWRDRLVRRAEIVELADALLDCERSN